MFSECPHYLIYLLVKIRIMVNLIHISFLIQSGQIQINTMKWVTCRQHICSCCSFGFPLSCEDWQSEVRCQGGLILMRVLLGAVKYHPVSLVSPEWQGEVKVHWIHFEKALLIFMRVPPSSPNCLFLNDLTLHFSCEGLGCQELTIGVLKLSLALFLVVE